MNRLRIHFLNVGRGDCTIIEHPNSGHVTVVDINNGKTLTDNEENHFKQLQKESKQLTYLVERYTIELDDPIDYLRHKIGCRTIIRFILTHPDCDHLTGMARLQQEMNAGSLAVYNFWNLDTIKKINEFKSDEEEESWNTYQKWKNKDFSRSYTRGDSYQYFNLDREGNPPGDGIHILSPDKKLLEDAKNRFPTKPDIYNNTSYILLLKYGQAKIILGGDAFGSEGSTSPSNNPQDGTLPNAWQYLLNTTDHNQLKNIALLKASHHGLESGLHPKAVELMNPQITIISEGPKQDQDAQPRYPNQTLSTRFYGTIVADVFVDGTVRLWTRKFRKNHGSRSEKNSLGFFLNDKSFLIF